MKNHCAATALEDFVNALWRVITALDFYKFKLEFGDESPLTMRARCSAFRYCPNPLGIDTAEQLGKLEFVNPILSGSKQIPHPVSLHNNPALYKKHWFLHSKAVCQVSGS